LQPYVILHPKQDCFNPQFQAQYRNSCGIVYNAALSYPLALSSARTATPDNPRENVSAELSSRR
jgi:hypothetical protein